MGEIELLVHYAIPIEFTFVTPLAPPANLNLSFFSEFQVAPERTSTFPIVETFHFCFVSCVNLMPPKKRGRPRKNPLPEEVPVPDPAPEPAPAPAPGRPVTPVVVLEKLTRQQVASMSSASSSAYMSAVGDPASQDEDLVEDDQLVIAEEGT